jgi:hypothetical protein
MRGFSMILKTRGDSPYNALYKTLEDIKSTGINTWDIGMFLDCATNYFESPTSYGRPELLDII